MTRAVPLLRNASALYALQVANYIIPLLTLPFLVRTLGAQAYGWLAFAAAVNMYVVLAVDAGMNTHAVRELARLDPVRQPQNAALAGALVIHVSLLKLLMTLLGAQVLWALVLHVPAWRSHMDLFALSFLPVLGSLCFPTWIFQGLQVMHHTLVFGLLGRLGVTLGLFLLIRDSQDLLWAAALQGSATLLSGLLALPILCRLTALRWSVPRWSGVWSVFWQSRSLTVSEFALTALSNSTVFMVGLVQSKEVVGVYAAIEKALRAAAGLFTPLIQAMQPLMVQGWQKSGPTDPPQVLQRWSRRVAWLAVLVALSGGLVTPWGLHILFGPVTLGYAHWGQILCAWLPFYVCNAVLGYWWWVASGQHALYARRVLMGGAVQVSVFLVVLGVAGVTGALWAWVACEGVMTGLLWLRRPWKGGTWRETR